MAFQEEGFNDALNCRHCNSDLLFYPELASHADVRVLEARVFNIEIEEFEADGDPISDVRVKIRIDIK